MPEDPEGAVFAYNHADWDVAEVMARAACFSGIGNGALGGLSLIPKSQKLVCSTADGSRQTITNDYMNVFQDAAGRYDLDHCGLLRLAAGVRIESALSKGMSREQLSSV